MDAPKFCYCLAPIRQGDWLKEQALLDWIESHREAWSMIPERLKRVMFNHSAKPENLSFVDQKRPMYCET